MMIKRCLWFGILLPIASVNCVLGEAQAQETTEEVPEEVSLECREFNAGFYTILPQEEDGIPLLTYQATDLPEETCQEATERLNTIISNRGNSPLSSMLLRTGTVQSQDVVCAVFRVSSGCSSRNVVLNIPPGVVPADFLEGLLSPDIEFFSLGDPNQHTRRRTYAEIGQGIQRKLKMDGKLTP